MEAKPTHNMTETELKAYNEELIKSGKYRKKGLMWIRKDFNYSLCKKGKFN